VLASIEDFRNQLEKEIKEYEALKSGRSKILKERNIADLPSIIIEYKIAHNLTYGNLQKCLVLKNSNCSAMNLKALRQ